MHYKVTELQNELELKIQELHLKWDKLYEIDSEKWTQEMIDEEEDILDEGIRLRELLEADIEANQLPGSGW